MSIKDKVAHVGAYLGLGIFLGWFLQLWAGIVLMLILAILWELFQRMLNPKSEIDLYDIASSLIGGIIGMVFIKLI